MDDTPPSGGDASPAGDNDGDTDTVDPCNERFWASNLEGAAGCESILSLVLTGSDVVALSLPDLRHVTGGSLPGVIQVSDNPMLTSVHLPSLLELDALVVDGNPLLSSLTLGAVECIGEVVIEGCPLLRECDVSALQVAAGRTCDSQWTATGLAQCD